MEQLGVAAQGLAWSVSSPTATAGVPTVSWRTAPGNLMSCTDSDAHPQARGLRHLLEAAGAVPPCAGSSPGLPRLDGDVLVGGRLYPWPAIPRHVLGGELARVAEVAIFMRARAEVWGSVGVMRALQCPSEGGRDRVITGTADDAAAEVLEAAHDRAMHGAGVRLLVQSALARNARVLQQINPPPYMRPQP